MHPPAGLSAPPSSALQTLLDQNPPQESSPHLPQTHHLALKIAHNLHYQHLWTDIRIHTTSPNPSQTLPRPLISGIPPTRLYVHPDEQIELLQTQKELGKTGLPDLQSEREWVLPSHLREKWSLKRFGETFEGIGAVPERANGRELFPASASSAEDSREEEAAKPSKWRTTLPKRILLGTLDDDSTVVYYIVHDGIVKPRQN